MILYIHSKTDHYISFTLLIFVPQKEYKHLTVFVFLSLPGNREKDKRMWQVSMLGERMNHWIINLLSDKQLVPEVSFYSN